MVTSNKEHWKRVADRNSGPTGICGYLTHNRNKTLFEISMCNCANTYTLQNQDLYGWNTNYSKFLRSFLLLFLAFNNVRDWKLFGFRINLFELVIRKIENQNYMFIRLEKYFEDFLPIKNTFAVTSTPKLYCFCSNSSFQDFICYIQLRLLIRSSPLMIQLFSATIQPIRMQNSQQMNKDYTGEVLVVSGFGLTQDSWNGNFFIII